MAAGRKRRQHGDCLYMQHEKLLDGSQTSTQKSGRKSLCRDGNIEGESPVYIVENGRAMCHICCGMTALRGVELRVRHANAGAGVSKGR